FVQPLPPPAVPIAPPRTGLSQLPGVRLRRLTSRPRNPPVPPPGRVKTAGSHPEAVPVRESLVGRAPRGSRPTAFLPDPPSRQNTCRGQIQACGSGTVASAHSTGSRARDGLDVAWALAPCLPQFGSWLPGPRRPVCPRAG